MVLRQTQTGNTCGRAYFARTCACICVRLHVSERHVHMIFVLGYISHNDIWNVSEKWIVSQGG